MTIQRGDSVHVLDHGFIRYVDSMGDDLAIVRSARVSFDAEWRSDRKKNTDEGLIRYLMKNQHTSPFESVEFQFEVKCPMFIARQWHRHRTWAYNEVSARYTELPREFYVPRPEHVGVQSKDNKQAREFGDLSASERRLAVETAKFIRSQGEAAFEAYDLLLGNGVPRELARSVLPMSTYTRFFAKVDLHNLMHFVRLRLHPHAQWEIQQYAAALTVFMKVVAPVATEAFLLTCAMQPEEVFR